MEGSQQTAIRIVVTGRGVVSAIGTSIKEFATSLAQGRGGIQCHDDLMPGQSVHVGLVGPLTEDPGPDPSLPDDCDRAAQLASSAALQAMTEAGLWNGTMLRLPGQDVALLLGSSHGGRSQIDRFVTDGMDTEDPDLAYGVMELGAHYHQTAVVASRLGIHGPVVTLSTACSSSGTAIAHGIDLLRTGRVRAVLAGGADAFSRLTFAGFQALGAVADNACGPFGGRIGISLGEGAAFVVLERHEDAIARGATPLAELFGCATTWDAHHLTAPEPSGDGMRRAIEQALAMAGLQPAAVDYVNAHGTGTRANDIAETLAIKRVFADAVPSVSATKSFTGHTLGASSAVGLLAGIAGMHGGWLPPTLNFDGPRSGCDLDYVPDIARPASFRKFLALSAAFGGCNCAIVAGDPSVGDVGAKPYAAPAVPDTVVVTGIGVMSTLGCDPQSALAAAFEDGVRWASDADLLAVRDFDPKRHLPRTRAARMHKITQFSVAAIDQALSNAGWAPQLRQPNAIGLMVGLSRGAAGSFQSCIESVRGGTWGKASPIAFPNLVMSSVGGQASVALGLKGAASTLVGEADVGIALIGHAAELLGQRPDIDALVVLTADELTPLFLKLQQTAFGPPTLPLAEGAVALVLERESAARARGIPMLARIAGLAQSFDATAGSPDVDADGVWLEQAIRSAMARADRTPTRVDLGLTLARGAPHLDRREAAALLRIFGRAMPPVGALAGHAGWAEASGGLLAVAMAIIAMQRGRVPAPASRFGAMQLGAPWLATSAQGDFRTALVAGSSRHGSNAAVLLTVPDRP